MFRHSLAGRPGSRLARSLLLGAALSAALAAPALANPFETTLANGMKLIVKEDRRAPSVVPWFGAAPARWTNRTASRASPTSSST